MYLLRLKSCSLETTLVGFYVGLNFWLWSVSGFSLLTIFSLNVSKVWSLVSAVSVTFLRICLTADNKPKKLSGRNLKSCLEAKSLRVRKISFPDWSCLTLKIPISNPSLKKMVYYLSLLKSCTTETVLEKRYQSLLDPQSLFLPNIPIFQYLFT